MLLNGGSTVPGVVQCHGFFIPTWSGTSPGAVLLDERNVNSFFFSFFLFNLFTFSSWCCSVWLREIKFRSLFTHSVTLEVGSSILTMSDLHCGVLFFLMKNRK